MNKDDEKSEEARYKILEEFAPKSGHARDRWDASLLQGEVKQAEHTNLSKGLDYYEPEEVNQAIVHTREDIVLMVSYLTSNNRLLNRINNQLSVIICLLLLAAGFLIWSMY